jgi:hypothetical protein
MARGKLIRVIIGRSYMSRRADGLMPSAPVSARLRMRWEKAYIRSANLDPYGDWIEICSDAQNL